MTLVLVDARDQTVGTVSVNLADHPEEVVWRGRVFDWQGTQSGGRNHVYRETQAGILSLRDGDVRG